MGMLWLLGGIREWFNRSWESETAGITQLEWQTFEILMPPLLALLGKGKSKIKLLPHFYTERKKKGSNLRLTLGFALCWFLYTTRLYYTLGKKKIAFVYIRPKSFLSHPKLP